MTEEMRVLVYDGPHRMHIEERARPEPDRGQVRLRMAYVGICGSDLHGYTGESGRRVPGMVMGHEASGWVEAVGPSVEGLAVGDAVTFNPALACDGRCGHTAENRCAELRVVGVTPEIQGAFADALVIDARRVVGLGSLDLISGAMAEPMAVATQTVRRCAVGTGDTVLVVGGGMIGQCVARAAQVTGARSVVISEPKEARRALATAAGFEAIEPDSVGDIAPFDVVVDAVGVSATASAAIRAVRKGGTVGFVGLGVPEVSIPLFDVVVPERTIVGAFCYTDAVFSETVIQLERGSVDLSPLLGSVEPFDEIPDAFEALATGKREDVKILMTTGASRPGVPDVE